ncbi:GNAT family N-acetyltransferase [Hymenobacter cellulosivorans]|uniref:GNAT family N-acetyltransferase n=1 Tax=Hymenobacter cellulosivorans TaxID=2932249 RepID=A0ABY4FEV1_9BACT|nr:GNAT family N-acetyltransferase [Hymenobacter cellulosivorans]UOQ55206.1 GNAT family N-acetyltransferase [Hymenobacter cellulosivorans]
MLTRQALLTDIPQLMQVRVAVRENRLSDPTRVPYEAYVDYLTRRGRGWVAEDAGSIVAFAIADVLDHSVWALFVHPHYEGQGLGKNLLDQLLAWYFQQTTHPIWLSTAPGTRAEEFYRRQGWHETGRTSSGEVRFERASQGK